MKITRGFLRATVCGAALFSAGILTTTTNNAFAACGTGGQCSVTGGYGTGTTFTGGTYWATDYSWSSGSPALRAVNPGSSINATDITVQPIYYWWGTQGYAGYKAQAENGGSITLTDASLSGGLNGLLATGDNSHITMIGGKVDVVKNIATVRDSSSLTLTGGVTLDVTDSNVVGVHARDDSVVRFGSATVKSWGFWSTAIRAGERSQLSFAGTDIAVYGNSSRGIDAVNSATVGVRGGQINAAGSFSSGIIDRDNAIISLDRTSIVASGDSSYGLQTRDSAKANLKNVTLQSSGSYARTVGAFGSSELMLDNVNVIASGGNAGGLQAFESSKTAVANSKIEASGAAAFAVQGRGDAEFSFDGTHIVASGNSSYGLLTQDYAKVSFEHGTLDAFGQSSVAVRGRGHSDLSFNETAIVASNLNSRGLFLYENAIANFENGTIEASGQNSSGIHVSGHSFLNLDDVSITAKGVAKGIAFGGGLGSPYSASAVNMTNSSIVASTQSTAIKSQGDVSDHWFNIQNSEISGGRLFDARELARLNIDADNSVLTGFSYVGASADLSVNLQNSLWTLRPDGPSGTGVNSSVSRLNFANSLLRFDTPVGGVYQSLVVGDGNPGTRDVYNAGPNSWLEANALIGSGSASDRLVIRGNAGGQTVIKVNEMAGSNRGLSSAFGTNAADEGISLVRVINGAARADSFVLDGGQLSLSGSPYIHKLYAFNSGTDWDYRLQNEFIRTNNGWAPQVLPQVASYLTAPTALFQAGYMDVANLQNRLGAMRQTTSSSEDVALEGEKAAKMRGNFFLRGFGGDFNYKSDLAAHQYGYDADIRYAAVQAGGNLYGFETSAGEMIFGLAGSYGDLAFSPERLDSRKTSMDVWSASAYASWLGNNGFYVDTILSYGGFSGDVSTSRHSRAAALKGNSLTASVEVGQNFALGADGWSIEPQAQLTYQKLSFDRQYDVDDFAVVLGSPEQWVGRIGGKLSKDVAFESIERLQLYSKLNLIHGFGDGDRVFIGDDFRIGEFGTHVEAGVGLTLDMTKNASFYGDATYQARVGGGGSNGFSLNGGLKFQF